MTIMGLRGKRSPSQPVIGEVSHVGEHEPEGERADLGVGDVELVLDLLLDAGEDVAVDVVDEVEGGEEDEGGGGSGYGGFTGSGFGGGGHSPEG